MGRILIVDDEKSMRVTLGEFLLKEGFEVDVAANTKEAYELISKSTYDIVVTDIIMPGESGIEMVKNIRKVLKEVQIIVITGEPTVDTAIKSIQSSANDYLVKPITKELFLKTIYKAYNLKIEADRRMLYEKQSLLYQKKLEDIIKLRTHALERSMLDGVTLLLSVIEFRDPYTSSHQRKVGNLCAEIAKKLNYDINMINFLRLAGYIHDIGKALIPAEMLSKSGALTKIEKALVQSHAAYGYDMIKKLHLPKCVTDAICQHHERCDGSGYPNGLKADEITKEAHILIIADVIDAITSHRPYRPALGLEVALAEIKNNIGKYYDKEIALAFIELFEKDGYETDDAEHKIVFPPPIL